MKLKFILITHRNPDDFIFGSWKCEHHSDGTMIKRGLLKKTKNYGIFQEVKRVK